MRKQQHPDRRMLVADLGGGHQPFVSVGGWHLDVDDGDIGPVQDNHPLQGGLIADQCYDLDADLSEQSGQALPQQHLVVGAHDSHGSPILINPAPMHCTVPPSAPTRSSAIVRSSVRLLPASSMCSWFAVCQARIARPVAGSYDGVARRSAIAK